MSIIFHANENNLDEVFSKFYSLLTTTIDSHAPPKKLSKKQKRLKTNSWITKRLLTSIKKKMHKTNFIQGTSIDQLFHKTYVSYCPLKVIQ